jgi:glycosyltransferase involved in cell wall biosynthesis
MSDPVAVSVIIPLYNAVDLIRDTVGTVLAQTWKDWELIVIDDGSTDGSGAVVRAFGERVRYYAYENGGVAKARNRGIALARGRYVALLDHDDLWAPTKLERQVEVLDRRPEVGLVTTGITHLERDGTPRLDAPTGPPSRFYQLFVKGFGPTPSTVMIRRSVLERVGGFDERFSSAGMDDHELWPRIADVCELALVDEPLTFHRGKMKEEQEIGLWHRELLNQLLFQRYQHCPERRRFLLEERAAYLSDMGKWYATHGERRKGRALLSQSLRLTIREAWNLKTALRTIRRLAWSFGQG